MKKLLLMGKAVVTKWHAIKVFVTFKEKKTKKRRKKGKRNETGEKVKTFGEHKKKAEKVVLSEKLF